MPTLKRLGLGLLAWLWVASLLGTLVDLLALSGESQLEFSSNFVGVAVHWLVWLLVWPAASYWGWGRQLPRLMWRGIIGLIFIGFLSIMLGPLGIIGLTPVFYAADFFLGIGRWQTKYVYFQHGRDVMVMQESSPIIGGPHRRRVQLLRTGPLLQLVDPLPDNQPAEATAETPGYVGWTAVMKPDSAFSFDADEQKRLDAIRLAERRCLADKRRLDSLALAGHPARLVLPAATQQGANVFGCLVDGEVWRDYGTCFDGQACVDCGARGWLQPASEHKPGYKLMVRATLNNGPLAKEMGLYIPVVTGLGTYQLGRAVHVIDKLDVEAASLVLEENEQRAEGRRLYYRNTLDPLSTVTITRFDTVVHIVAGTFAGAVERRDSAQAAKMVSQGHFDVHYNSGN